MTSVGDSDGFIYTCVHPHTYQVKQKIAKIARKKLQKCLLLTDILRFATETRLDVWDKRGMTGGRGRVRSSHDADLHWLFATLWREGDRLS